MSSHLELDPRRVSFINDDAYSNVSSEFTPVPQPDQEGTIVSAEETAEQEVEVAHG